MYIYIHAYTLPQVDTCTVYTYVNSYDLAALTWYII